MPDLLLELFSEEIPARMQEQAASYLKSKITDALVDQGVTYEGAISFVTPRRLALHIAGLPLAAPDTKEERKGPRVDAPAKALEGFLKAVGLSSLEEAQIGHDPKKGDYYHVTLHKKGQDTAVLLKTIIEDVLHHFAWPKAMRWGSGRFKWVRPLHSILCTFGPETEEPEILPVTIEHITASNITAGHRFMAPEPLSVRRLDDYVQSLQRADVVLDSARRRDMIVHDAQNLAFARGFELVEDEGLLQEVAGLVEYPVVLMGQFDTSYLAMPDEVIRAAIRMHQKCFVVRERDQGRLAPYFILVSNIKAKDGGKAIIAGNERVVAARLADARFFWTSDLQTPLSAFAKKLDAITFHARLGSQGDRVRRLEALASRLAPLTGADREACLQAASLCKADLVSQMVGEFPELQGLMGRIYGEKQGLSADIAQALESHYKPLGPSDAVPDQPVAITVALADKLDMLAGFWAISEKPTGSKDPFALRRAALGIIRILLDNNLSVDINTMLAAAFEAHETETEQQSQLFAFLLDRLKIQLKNQGLRHDIIDAVFALSDETDLLRMVQRTTALQTMLTTPEGTNLLAGYKRAASLLSKEAEAIQTHRNAEPNADLFRTSEENGILEALHAVQRQLDSSLSGHDYAGAITALASLREPLDALFDNVIINDENEAVRLNRLRLLNALVATMNRLADFSKIEG
jgi:glycyl-tRNA synthetase beta chain